MNPLIPAETPIIQPPVPQVVYDAYVLTGFSVQRRPDGKTPASALLIPVVSATGQLAPAPQSIRVDLADVATAAQANPKVAAALAAVTEAVTDIAKAQRKI